MQLLTHICLCFIHNKVFFLLKGEIQIWHIRGTAVTNKKAIGLFALKKKVIIKSPFTRAVKKVTKNNPECYKQVAAPSEHEEPRDLLYEQGKLFSRHEFMDAYGHTVLNEICH